MIFVNDFRMEFFTPTLASERYLASWLALHCQADGPAQRAWEAARIRAAAWVQGFVDGAVQPPAADPREYEEAEAQEPTLS